MQAPDQDQLWPCRGLRASGRGASCAFCSDCPQTPPRSPHPVCWGAWRARHEILSTAPVKPKPCIAHSGVVMGTVVSDRRPLRALIKAPASVPEARGAGGRLGAGGAPLPPGGCARGAVGGGWAEARAAPRNSQKPGPHPGGAGGQGALEGIWTHGQVCLRFSDGGGSQPEPPEQWTGAGKPACPPLHVAGDQTPHGELESSEHVKGITIYARNAKLLTTRVNLSMFIVPGLQEFPS